MHVVCDNQYELYVNGKLVGSGADWRKMDVHDMTKLLGPGPNVIAVKGTNTDAGAAGLAARVIIKQVGGTFENYSTDATWRTSVKAIRQLDSAERPRHASGCRPRSMARWAPRCRGAMKW